MLGKSYKLATFAEIPVKLHWSFGLLVITLLFLEYRDHQSLYGVGFMALYIMILFLCVVLHEYGHALTAKRYGIKTRDIILSPIGGLARLEDIPEAPIKEFNIAIAGPLVNLVIAAVIGIVIYLRGLPFIPDFVSIVDLYNPTGLLSLVLVVNLALFVFNLIPAFPMDGGRILRALLSIKLDRVVATRIAMYVGRFLAVGMFVFAVYSWGMVLAVISVFVWYTSGAEYQNILLKDKLNNTLVSDIMLKEFTKVALDTTFHVLINTFRKTGENNYLVYSDDNRIIGTVPYAYIADVVQRRHVETVEQQYKSEVQFVSGNTPLTTVFDQMQNQAVAIVAVTGDDGEVIGVLDRHRFSDWMKKLQNPTSFFNRIFTRGK
jgi:Zn-dependent protease